MTLLRSILAFFGALSILIAAPAAADVMPPATGKPHLAMRLVAEIEHPRAGSTVTVALATTPEAGWHGYWRNPGDAGFAGDYQWTLPSGASAAAPQWPVPTTLMIAGLMNYVYEAPYAPLVAITVPAGVAPGTVMPLTLAADYLVCTRTLCVPEKQTLHLSLSVGDGVPGPEAGAFAGWRRAIPRTLDRAASYAVKDGGLTLAVPYPASAALGDAYFFPVTTGAIDYAAAQSIRRDGDRLLVATKGKGAGPIDGVLRIAPGQGLAIHAVAGPVGAAAGGWFWAALAAFGGALIGGLILNVMPCVFPILSLKALSLARANSGGGGAEAGARSEALAYTAGVILVCVGLGAAILALRAGGSAVGWAFQLQDPRAIVVLLLLSVAIALNLAGLFEVPMPRFAGEGGRAGAFATGALAAFVATPCTGPFMGAALGAALVLPAAAALAVFAGLGIGLALPFLLIGYVPALRRRLPRPGGWMETFRRILSVPMWLTAIALGWVLGREAGIDALAFALVASLGLALVLWGMGGRQRRGLGIGMPGLVLIALIVVAAPWLVPRVRASAGVAATTAGTEGFSERRLAALRAAKRPVFVYFTADWCLTCKVNERVAIDTAGVRAAFARRHVAVLEGDWTDGDAVLGAFIQAHNRAGVPLYLYYAPGATEPRVLPQVLTPNLLENLAA